MIKRYKTTEKDGMRYKEAWLDKQAVHVVVHSGKVGFTGKTQEFQVKDTAEADSFFKNFSEICTQEGFREISREQQARVVVQFPLKSEFGNKRDLWLKDKVQEYLKEYLGWRGLGDVDGYDMGNKKLNIFCLVVDENKAVSCIKTCLKEYRLDLTHARIAVKGCNEDEYRLKYSHKKIDKFGEF